MPEENRQLVLSASHRYGHHQWIDSYPQPTMLIAIRSILRCPWGHVLPGVSDAYKTRRPKKTERSVQAIYER